MAVRWVCRVRNFKSISYSVIKVVELILVVGALIVIVEKFGQQSINCQTDCPQRCNEQKQRVSTPAANWESINRMENDYWHSIGAETMTARQIVDYLKWSNRTACNIVHYFGGFLPVWKSPKGIDGQYPVCLDAAVRPPSSKTKFSFKQFKEKTKQQSQLDDRLCTVYSFGINDDWSFDEAMAEYGCRVFSFDPSMNKTDHDHSSFVHFYNLGLSDRDHIIDSDGSKWTMKRLDSIYRMLTTMTTTYKRHDAVIDYLKIDIEWDEWNVLPQIIASGMLTKVRQLTIEFHLPTKFIGPSSSSRVASSSSAIDLSLDDYRRLVAVIKSIEQQHGMVRFESRANPWTVKTIKALDHYVGPTCFEISFYQILPHLLT